MTYPKSLHIIHFSSIDSTNDYIKRNQKELSQNFPVMVQTDTQTSGRGRSDRIWSSPAKSGLYTSFGFHLNNKPKLSLLPLVTGIAIVEVLHHLGDADVFIKWPNDIISGNRKVAGILTETIIYGDQLTCISGIGINVNQDISEFPADLQKTATSLKTIYGHSFSIEKINMMLSRIFFRWIEKLERGEDEEISHTINHLSYHSNGDQITFHHGDRIIKGSFVRIDRDGGLIVQEAGKQRSYYSGEIQVDRV